MNPHDSSHQTEALIRHYQQLNDSEQPSPELDDAIVSYARASTRKSERWVWPVSVAAALLLTVGLFAHMSQLPSPAERSQWQERPAAEKRESAAQDRQEETMNTDLDAELRPDSPPVGRSRSLPDSAAGALADEAAEPLSRLRQAPSDDLREQEASSATATAAAPTPPASAQTAAADRRGERKSRDSDSDAADSAILAEQDAAPQASEPEARKSDAARERTDAASAETTEATAVDALSDATWQAAVRRACENHDRSTVTALLEETLRARIAFETDTTLQACFERLDLDLETIAKRVLSEQDLR